MAFPLLEDEEAYEAALALLDDCDVFAAGLPHFSSQLQSSQTPNFASEAAAWAAFNAAHPPPKSTSKHRNGAREQRRREVQFLRHCAKGLQNQLDALREGADLRAERQKLRDAALTQDSDESTALAGVWKDLATRQLDQRLASERENARLKSAMKDQRKLREMLQKALQTRVARRVMETSASQEKRTRRVHGVPLEASDQDVFKELEAGVDDICHEADMVFFHADTAGDGACLGVFGDKTLPFDLHTTAKAAWGCLAHSLEHDKYQFSYTRERKIEHSSEVVHDDTVVESFGVEIKAPETIADFRIKQVFRRYVEEDRIVISWRSFIDPAEFKGQKLQGIRFQEKGSMVVRQPVKQTHSSKFTLLRIWHVIVPETLGNSNENGSKFIQDLTDFVLNGSSSASTVQTIENMLVEQSLRKSTQ
ncbi:hypothetical protein PHYBOEH_010020 [Phytophthora boehmeriae]|uniref:M96 mating-specific protein family n=1 Tax=Phytophthora boehmeriae TaxID=109152 RepID=A0A8T1VTC2_9STRA|nr:hypothetical protein PHYBOEH_010020 [Phytophthora boehmeriae]